MSYCFGIDIGGTTVKCGLFTTEGVLLEKWEIKTRTEENGKAILPDVAETILKKMEEKGIEKTEVTGVGVGVPGPVVKKEKYRWQLICTGDIPCWQMIWKNCWIRFR